MKPYVCNLLLMTASVFPFKSDGRTSFTIDNNTYYIHQIECLDLRKDGYAPDKTIWNQNMVADRQYIYLADHAENTDEYLTIKRYNTINCVQSDNLDIKNLDTYGINEYYTDDERFFYIAQCNDNDHLILFFNTPADGIATSELEFYFYLIDKDGYITREFCARNVPNDTTFPHKCIADFGIPDFIGNPVEGNFEMLLPLIDYSGHMMVVKYAFENNKQSSYTAAYYNYDNINTHFSKPSVRVVNDSFIIIDDNDIYPSLYSHRFNTNNNYGELDSNNKLGHGCNWFNFDGHRFLCSGDIKYSDNDLTNGITQFNLGLWDSDNAYEPIMSRANPTISFNSYKPLVSLQVEENETSTIKNPGPISYTYRQFIATSDYGNNVVHLHLYVPGEFLATYQINKHLSPTSVDEINDVNGNRDVNMSISDKTITFDRPIADVYVYNMTGCQIFHSADPVKSINFANFVKGTYIIATPYKSFKILL